MPRNKEPENEALAGAPTLDFANLELDYEAFRQLAKNPHLTPDEKVAFGPRHRHGFEDIILEDICNKLPALRETNKTVIDIGCGIGSLTDRFAALCDRQGHRLVLVDSAEMLAQAPTGDRVSKIVGKYPTNADEVLKLCPAGADVILCYSVFHYVFVDTNVFSFIDSIIDTLAGSGMALIGDIPNLSKRNRFFSSASGIRFHKANMKTDQPPEIRHYAIPKNTIDDAVLNAVSSRSHAAGCHAYVLPQDRRLPMANRRDDLLIMKP
jgi:2-polyprenyl-3-methyl-5-hydroxy-6-metoxy-1,4-benzoquinol methylase